MKRSDWYAFVSLAVLVVAIVLMMPAPPDPPYRTPEVQCLNQRHVPAVRCVSVVNNVTTTQEGSQ